ncbi:hypothetical protein A9Q89_02870 [Gammaproteobacteria bacterium 53_120_T64]|nr:hypothetical protein A9Q89_02870 [Gammaproteobacteria bacterium 53_120_T64]
MKTLLLTFLLSCLGAHSYAENQTLNLDKFIGEWTGGYIHKNNIRKDSWVQTRAADGTFKLVYESYQYDVLSSTEINEGTWWIEGEYFYEKQNGVHDKADKYLYELIGKTKIKFTEISTDEKTSELIQGYSFTDTRVEK